MEGVFLLLTSLICGLTLPKLYIFTNCKLHEEARKKIFGIHFNNIKIILNRNGIKRNPFSKIHTAI